MGDLTSSVLLGDTSVFESGYYDIGIKKADATTVDIYINNILVGDNVDGTQQDRSETNGVLYMAEDIPIADEGITIRLHGGSSMADYITVTKKPSFYVRPQRIYILGDSLVCSYYGEAEMEVGGSITGWGRQLSNFVNIPITNLASGWQTAESLYSNAF